MNDTNLHTGSCRCGLIGAETAIEPFWVSYCHCRDCRKQTGAPVMAFVGFKEDDLAWHGTPQTWRAGGVARSFCGHCGSQIGYRDDKLPGEVSGATIAVYGQSVPVMGAAPEGPATAYIRPEDIEFAADGITGTVLATSFLGSLRRTTVVLADGTVVSVQHDSGHQPERDAAVRLRLRGRPAAVVAA